MNWKGFPQSKTARGGSRIARRYMDSAAAAASRNFPFHPFGFPPAESPGSGGFGERQGAFRVNAGKNCPIRPDEATIF